MNIIVFIPLGAIIYVFFRSTNGTSLAILKTTIAAIVILGIEILQFYIPRTGLFSRGFC